MLETVGGWIVGIFLVLYIPYTIYFNIVHFVCKWKCRNKHYNEYFNRCYEKECKWARYCDNYEHLYTEEEIQHLYKMIEDYQKRAK